ncbi:phage tail protein I [Vibrio spartinae]|uniref:Phage tail protein (Tail_P2_I) n=1 Tax=Vibrio spartinae TaxID=1918945 RepID=A0A1N6M6A1_9VIBR|nr:phage tail protein I [Vibrio spartinae]QMV14739.1 phage tail protein I [Vibrio spartinae]SIO94981.1 Phage tail protein (Tail_P2_I) [Vibrio spartinae]
MNQSKLPLALKTYSVLPDNRSPLERSMELSFSQQIYGIGNPYPHLLDAQKTAFEIVPYIASEFQLPVWDTSDPEPVKRNLAGHAWQVRKMSGTRAGLKLALESFDFQSQIKPWYQQQPQGQPYSLEIVAWEKGNKPVDVANVKKLLAYIEDTKSERDQIELSLMFGVETSIEIAGAIAPVTNTRETSGYAQLWAMPDATIDFSINGGAAPGLNVSAVEASAVIPAIVGHGQINMTGYSAHYNITVLTINARATL